jgi:hypothetical protein
MAGLRIVVIGQSGCGKTTLTKTFLKGRPKDMPCLIYDPNGEYKDFYNVPLAGFEEFLMKMTDENVQNTYIVSEEATIFFNAQTHNRDMTNLLVRARLMGNVVQLNFHSFGTVPKGIYTLVNYVIVFKTQDSEKSVKDRFDHPKVLEAFQAARDSGDEHFYTIVKIN